MKTIMSAIILASLSFTPAFAHNTPQAPTTPVYAGDASSSLTNPDPNHQAKASDNHVIVTLGTQDYTGDASSYLSQPIKDHPKPYKKTPDRTEMVSGDSGH